MRHTNIMSTYMLLSYLNNNPALTLSLPGKRKIRVFEPKLNKPPASFHKHDRIQLSCFHDEKCCNMRH